MRRRRLGGELKRCREAAGLTQEAVSRHFEWHAAKVTRIETARVAVTPRDVRDLLTFYGVRDPAYRASLTELAGRGRDRAWWSEYRDVMRSNFIGLEAEATGMLCWEPVVVPGLLQTESYMRAVIRATLPSEPREALERRIALRLRRQARLTGHQPLGLRTIIDESVLHRVVEDDDTTAGQLVRLRDAAALPNVTVRILPSAAGLHQLMPGAATILEYAGPQARDILYLESFTDTCVDRPAVVARFRAAFDELSGRALDERRSVDLIDNLIKG
ncbi:transcriptional regulator [Amorphoplanes nipponensis]|uniref:Transcriptional regulator n=1 Tax=Actinoplanes nipponensis TaxID=135950 RepID=A0A919JL50_9ACTN|nr:transcriptional regulator [Actinoplanes nipponensis]